jgi:hypothetical protein
MMRRTPLHIARVSNDDPPKIEVLDSNEIARGYLDVAMELWRLAGHEDRASAIQELIYSAQDFEPPRWMRAQITELRALLDGIEQALVGTVTDEHHLLSPEKAEEIRGVEVLEIGAFPGADPRYAIQSALIYIFHLRNLADEALANDASILFD